MNYALKVLLEERQTIEKCLQGFNKEDYKEAFNKRKNKLEQLNKAIKKLKQ